MVPDGWFTPDYCNAGATRISLVDAHQLVDERAKRASAHGLQCRLCLTACGVVSPERLPLLFVLVRSFVRDSSPSTHGEGASRPVPARTRMWDVQLGNLVTRKHTPHLPDRRA